jgi:hypothetical protein
MIFCTKSPNQNIDDVVIKKNNQHSIIVSLLLLKNLGFDFSISILFLELKMEIELTANNIKVIAAI